MKTLYKRTLTGIFYVAFIVIFLISGPLTYYILLSGFLIIGSIEFFRAFANNSSLLRKISIIITSSIVFTACFFDAARIFQIPFTLIIAGWLMINFIPKIFIRETSILKNSGQDYIIFFYLTIPIALTNYLVFLPDQKFSYNYQILLNIFILLWCNDSGAYITGTSIGRNLLLERVSPKKTWEGFIGGLLITIAASYVISKFNTQLTMIHWLIVGALTAIFGTLGDLTESMLKRNANLKDSGNIFPGHGGLLDRIDSFLFAVIVKAFTYYLIFRQ